MRRRVGARFWLAWVLGLAVILGSVATPLLSAAAKGTPVASTSVSGSLPDMLRRLPGLPLAQSNASITYTNLAAQAVATGVPLTNATATDHDRRQWESVVLSSLLPSMAPEWIGDDWGELVGFDIFQIEQSIEYYAPPLRISVLRGSFDPDTLREAWKLAGYQPIDLGSGEAYAIRDDFAFDLEEPISRMVLNGMNVLAIRDDGTLITGTDRVSVAGALAAASDEGRSMLDQPDIAPLAATAPDDLASAMLFPGRVAQYAPDLLGGAQDGETPDDLATRVAVEQAEAQHMPPVGSLLLGLTAGYAGKEPGTTRAKAIVALSMGSAAAAERGATVVSDRLETAGPPPTRWKPFAGRTWAELFPERSVDAVADEGIVLVTLTPGPDVRLISLPFLTFSHVLSFMAW